MDLFRDVLSLRAWTQIARDQNQRVAFVPTMGALHDGHLSLVEQARKHADRVLVSIFVNPTQFGPTEDLSRYPRDEAGDLAKLRSCKTDAIFLPTVLDMYPAGFQTKIQVPGLARHLCGATRPEHFGGVCTVVAMLFRMTQCNVAIFGEKDFQQLQIIKRLTKDLWLDVDVIHAPIAREADGLARSSRNQNLSQEERAQAPRLHEALRAIAAAVAQGERGVGKALDAGRRVLEKAALGQIDYLAIAEEEILEPLQESGPLSAGKLRAFGALKFKGARIIDNVSIDR